LLRQGLFFGKHAEFGGCFREGCRVGKSASHLPKFGKQLQAFEESVRVKIVQVGKPPGKGRGVGPAEGHAKFDL